MDADRVWIDEETDVRVGRQSVPGGVGVDDVDGGVLKLPSASPEDCAVPRASESEAASSKQRSIEVGLGRIFLRITRRRK